MVRIFWWVNVYEMDRRCGGPEEGGWWYDVGDIMASFKRLTHKGAEKLQKRLQDAWPEGEGIGSRYSAAYTGQGDFKVYLEPHKGEDFNNYQPYE